MRKFDSNLLQNSDSVNKLTPDILRKYMVIFNDFNRFIEPWDMLSHAQQLAHINKSLNNHLFNFQRFTDSLQSEGNHPYWIKDLHIEYIIKKANEEI